MILKLNKKYLSVVKNQNEKQRENQNEKQREKQREKQKNKNFVKMLHSNSWHSKHLN